MLSQISKWTAGKTPTTDSSGNAKQQAAKALETAASAIDRLIRYRITQKKDLSALKDPVNTTNLQNAASTLATAPASSCPEASEALNTLATKAQALHDKLTGNTTEDLRSELEGLKGALKRAATQLTSALTCNATEQLNDLKDRANALTEAANKAVADGWFKMYNPATDNWSKGNIGGIYIITILFYYTTIVYHRYSTWFTVAYSFDNKRAEAVKALNDLAKVIEKHKDTLGGKGDVELKDVKDKATGLQEAASGLKTALESASQCTEPDGAKDALTTLETKASRLSTATGDNEVQQKLTALQTPLTQATNAIQGCSELTQATYKDKLQALTKAANTLKLAAYKTDSN